MTRIYRLSSEGKEIAFVDSMITAEDCLKHTFAGYSKFKLEYIELVTTRITYQSVCNTKVERIYKLEPLDLLTYPQHL